MVCIVLTLPYMPRLLTLAFLLVSSAIALPAQADVGAIDVQLGGMQLKTPAGSEWHPTVRLAGSVNLIGPLQAGGFVNLTAEAFPLRSPRLGGGVALTARPQFGRLRLIFETSIGRLRLPTSQTASERTWAVGATAGVGVELSERVVLETRLTHQFLMGNELLGGSSWLVLSGLSFTL